MGKIKRNIFYYKIVRNIGYAIVSVIAYYFIFSPHLDNPIEVELKKTNRNLKDQLVQIQESVVVMDSAYSDLNKRDLEIYTQLFSIAPLNQFEMLGEKSRQNIEMYENASTDELLEIFSQKTKTLAYEVETTTPMVEYLAQEMNKLGNRFLRFPSVQPIDNPDFTKTFVGSGMKINPFYKGIELHSGVDYAVEEGTRVFATADGVVSKIGTNISDKGGLSIEIDHQNGYRTRYSNLSKTIVRRNETVSRGDIIAYSGNSGYSFLPHLHYEVLYKNRNLQPENFLFADLTKLDYFYLRYRANETIQSFD